MDSIKVFKKGTLKKGAKIVLSNKIFLPNGIMGDHMRFILGNDRLVLSPTIFILYRNNKPISTAFTFKYINEKYFRFQVFVLPLYRRRGIGTKLFNFARGYLNAQTFDVERWDNRSESFFDSIFPLKKVISVDSTVASKKKS